MRRLNAQEIEVLWFHKLLRVNFFLDSGWLRRHPRVPLFKVLVPHPGWPRGLQRALSAPGSLGGPYPRGCTAPIAAQL